MSRAQTTIMSCEDELAKLKNIREFESNWNPLAPAGIARRVDYLLKKLEEAESTRNKLDREISNLKAILVKDDTARRHFREK